MTNNDVTRHCPMCADLVARLRDVTDALDAQLTLCAEAALGTAIGDDEMYEAMDNQIIHDRRVLTEARALLPELTAPCPECDNTTGYPCYRDVDVDTTACHKGVIGPRCGAKEDDDDRTDSPNNA